MTETQTVQYGYADNAYDGHSTYSEYDQLGTTGDVAGLAKFIQHCETPMTIALQGDWGTGKTSFMNAIGQELEPDTQTIFFRTWEYSRLQSSDDMYAAFGTQIVAKLEEGDGVGEIKSEKAKAVLKGIAMTLASAGTAVLRYGIESAKGPAKPLIGALAKKPIDTLEASYGSIIDTFLKHEAKTVKSVSELKTNFAELVEQRVGENGRVVIFIDDLDRLDPKTAVEFLELLKLFFDVPRCVFVLAVDYEVIVSGIGEKFKGLPGEKSRSFFDKIIQLPFNMPVGNYDIQTMFQKMFQEKTGDYTDAIVHSFGEILGANPRVMKRLYNLYELQVLVNEQREGNTLGAYESALLLINLIVQLKSPDEYKQIVSVKDAESMEKLLGDSTQEGQSAILKSVYKAYKAIEEIAGGTAQDNAADTAYEDFLQAAELSTMTYTGATSRTRAGGISRVELPGSEAMVELNPPVSVAKAMTMTFERILNRYLGESPTDEKKQDVRNFIEANSTFLSFKERNDAQFVAKRVLNLHGFAAPVYLATHNGTAGKQEYVERLCKYMNGQYNGKTRLEIAKDSVAWVKADGTRLGCYPVSVKGPASDTREKTSASGTAQDASTQE